MTNRPSSVIDVVEQLLTLKAAAEKLGLPLFKLRRAAASGLIPTYSLLNGRKLVRVSEVIAVVERSRSGPLNWKQDVRRSNTDFDKG